MKEKKGLATGIAFTGSVAGGFVFVQITKSVLASHNWQMAYVVLALISAVILLPTTIFLVKEHPRDKGLLPFGAKETSDSSQTELLGITLKKYIKTSSFWLLAASFFIIGFALVFGLVSSMTTVTPPYVAASIVGVREYSTIYGILSLFYGIGVATGPVVAGKVYDSFGSYAPVWIAFSLLSLILMLAITQAVKKAEGFARLSDKALNENI